MGGAKRRGKISSLKGKQFSLCLVLAMTLWSHYYFYTTTLILYRIFVIIRIRNPLYRNYSFIEIIVFLSWYSLSLLLFLNLDAKILRALDIIKDYYSFLPSN